ncbi:uncharacterized protein ACN427_004149 [Glossina fuscipes fuscipes]
MKDAGLKSMPQVMVASKAVIRVSKLRTYAQKMMDRSDGGLQTSPLQNTSGAKRTQPEAREHQQPGDVDTPTAKRRNVVTIHKAAEKHAANVSNDHHPSKDVKCVKVRARSKKKRKADRPKRRLKGRPDAIIIAGKSALSYAGMLCKVKDEPQLSQFEEAVQKIKRT